MTERLWIGESRGIRLRAYEPHDVETYRRWLQPDQEWHRWNGPYGDPITTEEADAACERLAASIADGSYRAQPPLQRAAIVTVGAPDDLIGTVSWHWEAEESDWRRMGLAVYDPAIRGRGLGTEAFRIWTDYLFSATEVVRLDYATWSGNERMLAVGRRLGFTEEGRFRDAREVRGERYDSVVMGILRREWDAASDHSTLAPSATS